MTQPKFAPIPLEDEVRPVHKLDPPLAWMLHRPAEFTPSGSPGRGRGAPGPDQGYAMRLADGLSGEVIRTPGEHLDDIIAGAVAVAMRRAALFGRAPVRSDLEVAFGLFGYLDTAPVELVAARKLRFAGCAHDYWTRRALADMVPEEALRLAPAPARSRALGTDA